MLEGFTREPFDPVAPVVDAWDPCYMKKFVSHKFIREHMRIREGNTARADGSICGKHDAYGE